MSIIVWVGKCLGINFGSAVNVGNKRAGKDELPEGYGVFLCSLQYRRVVYLPIVNFN